METLAFIAIGAIMGMVGGVLYIIVHSLNTWEQIVISLLLSCAFGIIAGINAISNIPEEEVLILAVFFGYIGVDLVISPFGRKEE